MPHPSPLPPSLSPTDEYIRRRQARQQRVDHLEKIHLRLGNLRLLLAALTLASIWWRFERTPFSNWWLLLPVLLFAALVIVHAGILQRRSRAERAVEVYRKGLARIDDRWIGIGSKGEAIDTSASLYAADLDLFGHGSLFQLLSQARTRMGEDTLAGWLLRFSPLDQIKARQAAIDDLRHRLDLREDMAILGDPLTLDVHPEPLTAWAESANLLPPRLRWLCLLLSAAALTTAVLWGAGGSKNPFFLVLLAEGTLFAPLRTRIKDVLQSTQKTFEDVQSLVPLLNRLEREQFEAPHLKTIKQTLSSPHLGAFRAISQLGTIVQCIYSLDNQIVRLFDIPLLYSLQIAYAAEKWRVKHGGALRSWLDAIGEIEALLSISGYSYEHPNDPFPEFVEGNPTFIAHQIGHPLIAAAKCVRNDVTISGETRLLVISGSNMSGKSTLMRAIGINTVLAMAGAPVRAQRLQLTPLQLGASILVNDSLLEGNSRFYAEIRRLRRICTAAAETPPLLFLLDELLQGTNSHDRLIGAEGIVKILIGSGAIGLISTHDLSLTKMSPPTQSVIRNLHFQDEIIGDKVVFDFRLREGVVAQGNGLKLMRLIGLSV